MGCWLDSRRVNLSLGYLEDGLDSGQTVSAFLEFFSFLSEVISKVHEIITEQSLDTMQLHVSFVGDAADKVLGLVNREVSEPLREFQSIPWTYEPERR